MSFHTHRFRWVDHEPGAGYKPDVSTHLLQRSGAEPAETLRLSRDLVRSLRRGHAWVFADALRGPPRGTPGGIARLLDAGGRAVAMGYVDPGSPLAFRACVPEGKACLDDRWAAGRIEAAIALREQLIDRAHTTGYRLLHGEGDGVPGLVCDVYGDTAVVRLDGPAAAGFWSAAGVGRWVADRLGLRRVYERDRTRGAPAGRALVGDAPAEPVPFLEHGLRFTADVVRGQKTGFFLDQRESRRRVGALAAGRRVLNVFGYTGGFSVYAAAGGATHVTTVDLAAPAIAAAEAHVALNDIPAERHRGVVADAFDFLDAAAAEGERWGLVVLDPPSFAPSRRTSDRALGSYVRLITAGARVVEEAGFLLAASCSSHVSLDAFVGACEDAVGRARRRATVLGVHGQPADHPTPLPMRDFRYLKVVSMRVA